MNRQNNKHEHLHQHDRSSHHFSWFIVVLVIAFSIGTISPIFADSASSGGSVSLPKVASSTGTLVKAASLVTIFVSGKSYFTLDEAAFSTSTGGRYAYFTWTFHNHDDFSFKMNNYFMRLTNGIGTPFSVKLLPEDKVKNKVPAQGSIQLHYYAKVNDSTNWSDLVVKLIQWDFGAAQFEKTLWKFTIPQTYSNVTPVQMKRNIITGGGKLQAGVTELMLNRADDQATAFLTLALENTGDNTMTLPGYSYNLETKDRRSYPLQVVNLQDIHLTPLFHNHIQLVGSLPKEVDLSGSKLTLTQNDDTLQLRLPIASFVLPQHSTGIPATLAGNSHMLQLPASGTSVTTSVYKAVLNLQDDAYHVSVYFKMENIGQKSAAVPNYSYAIETTEGNIYPLDPTVTKDLVITPGIVKDLKFDIVIPISQALNGWKLRITQEDLLNHVSMPIAAYELPEIREYNAGTTIGNEYALTLGSTTSFSAKLNALQRLPWDDQDIITAEITLKNTGLQTAALPLLQGYFLLNEHVKVNATFYPLDPAISLNPQASSSSIFYAKIPVSTSFNQIKFVMQQKDDSQVVHTLAELSGTNTELSLPLLAKGDPYKVTEIGKLLELSLSNSCIYKGTDSDLYYAEIEMKNLEKRVAFSNNWTGYLKTTEGIYYPITLTNPPAKINPESSSVIALWGILPTGIPMSELSLLIGRAVSGAPSAGVAPAAVNAYVKAVEMPMPTEAPASQLLNKLQIKPYTISLSNVKTQIASAQSFAFSFDYTLTKDPISAHIPQLPAGATHKLILQLTDTQGQKYEQKIDLDTSDGLSIGSSNYSFTKTDPDLFFLSKMQLAQQYTLKIYDEFQGYRLLLTTQVFKWIG